MPELLAPEHRSGNLKIASGQVVTVTATDSVATGLNRVYGAIAVLESAPAINADRAQAVVANQVTTPGYITINTYKPTATTDATPIAATTPFAKTVSWLAWGI
jgi:hypothetical protein